MIKTRESFEGILRDRGSPDATRRHKDKQARGARASRDYPTLL